jgi:molybdopterin synthase sulfur carrier subunit
MGFSPNKQMKIKLVFFGQVRDITGSTETELSNISSIPELKNKLFSQFPALKDSKFLISVNRKIADDKTSLCNGDEVAILPPFAGG